MKISALLLAFLAANSLALESLPLSAPSRVTPARRAYLFDMATDGFRKLVAVGESPKLLRLGSFYTNSKGEWVIDSTNPDCGDAMDPMFYGIARSSKRFVAVGQHNFAFQAQGREYPVISVSDDGISWQASLGPAKGALWGVATNGEDHWVAVGSNQILVSKDGAKTWTISTDQVGGEARAVHRGGADWMTATLVSGPATRFHVSALGSMWSHSSDFPGVKIHSLSEHNGTWIAVGEYVDKSRTCILRSTNQGGKWTEVGPAIAGTVLNDVTLGANTGFVAVGREGGYGLALWSRDGLSWQKIYNPFSRELRAVQLWESPGGLGSTEIAILSDTGTVWLDTLEFDTRQSTTDVRVGFRSMENWKQVGHQLEAPRGISENIQVTISSYDGRLEHSSSVRLGSSRRVDLSRSRHFRIVHIRDEAGNVHVQKLAPTVQDF